MQPTPSNLIPIDGFPDYYIDRELGQIFSSKTGKIKQLKPRMMGNRLKVQLYKDQIGQLYSIHVLIARATVPNPEGFRYVGFKDGDPCNTKPANLVWVSSNQYVLDIGKTKQYRRKRRT